jgi:serine protease Do
LLQKQKLEQQFKVKIWRNKKELTKNILLGRLETSDDFKVSDKKTETPKDTDHKRS